MSARARDPYDRRLASLKSARSPYEADLKDIATYIDPRKARWDAKRRGHDRDQRILNATARLAQRTTQAGLSAGISSAARPWFRLATPDPDMMEFGPVRDWLYRTNLVLLDICAKSNAYHILPRIYGDEATYGNGVMLVDADFDDVLTCHTYPVGEYCLATGKNGRVNTLYRETAMTVGQMVEEFGKAVSPAVMRLYDKSETESMVSVIHVIEPNDRRIEGRAGLSGKAYRTVWIEADDSRGELLHVGGYHECPIMAPRWEVIGNDPWGVGPGHDALGDAIAIQKMELTKHRLIHDLQNPSKVAPTTLKSSLDGRTTIFADDDKGTRVLHEVNPQGLLAMRQEIEAAERRIDSVFFKDVFLMIANSASPQRTAMEVMELKEEKLVLLGPMLTRQFHELLDPFIDRVYALASRAKLLPPPPPELQGETLGVEYISMLAVAQKAAEVQGIRDLGAFVGAMMSIDPSVAHKFAADQAVDDFARSRAINPRLVVPDDKVAERREAEARQKQTMEQAAMAKAAIEGAQTLAATPLEGNTALSALMGP